MGIFIEKYGFVRLMAIVSFANYSIMFLLTPLAAATSFRTLYAVRFALGFFSVRLCQTNEQNNKINEIIILIQHTGWNVGCIATVNGSLGAATGERTIYQYVFRCWRWTHCGIGHECLFDWDVRLEMGLLCSGFVGILLYVRHTVDYLRSAVAASTHYGGRTKLHWEESARRQHWTQGMMLI